MADYIKKIAIPQIVLSIAINHSSSKSLNKTSQSAFFIANENHKEVAEKSV